MIEHVSNDLAKEVITVLSFTDNNIINLIPNDILKYLNDLAADSTHEYPLYDKDLLSQNISDECKSILSTLYLKYIADENIKKELEKYWF